MSTFQYYAFTRIVIKIVDFLSIYSYNMAPHLHTFRKIGWHFFPTYIEIRSGVPYIGGKRVGKKTEHNLGVIIGVGVEEEAEIAVRRCVAIDE